MNIHDLQLHFSIRKLSVGVVSCLIGICFISSNQTVQADSMPIASNNKSVIISNSSSNSNPTETKSSNKQDIVDSNNTSPAQIDSHSNQNSRSNSNPTETIASKSNNKQNIVDSNNTSPTQNNSHSNQNSTKMVLVNSKLNISSQQPATTDSASQQSAADSAKNKLKMATLKTTTDEKLNTKMLAESKTTTMQATDTNGGFDSSWGKLDVNDWKGSVKDNYYQLTDYTGDANHVIVPNEADFAKAGISTSGKPVGVTSTVMHNIFKYKATAYDATVAFSKTNNKMVKAIGSNWGDTWGHEYYGDSKAKLSKFDGTNLDVSNVTNMSYMFYGNQISDLSPLANWKVDNVTDMRGMFIGNQISDLSPLANWKVGHVTDMSFMFGSNHISNLSPLANWKLDSVTNMTGMFEINHISDLSPLANWKLDSVTDTTFMFFNNQISDLSPLTNWKVDNVTYMKGMFEFNHISDLKPLSNWKVYNVTNMSGMFDNNSSTQTKTIQAKRVINFVYPVGYTGQKQDPVTQRVDVPRKVRVKLTTKDSKPSNNILDWVTKTETPETPEASDHVNFPTYTVPKIDYLVPSMQTVAEALADPNKPITVTVTYTAAPVIVHFKDVDPNADKDSDAVKQELGTSVQLSGAYGANVDLKGVNLPENFVIAEPVPANAKFGTISSVTVKLKHVTSRQPLEKRTGTRTITITFPDKTVQTVVQSVGMQRTNTLDKVTSKTSHSDWSVEADKSATMVDGKNASLVPYVIRNGQIKFASYKLPHVSGYKAVLTKKSPATSLFMPSFLSFTYVPLNDSKAQKPADKPVDPKDNQGKENHLASTPVNDPVVPEEPIVVAGQNDEKSDVSHPQDIASKKQDNTKPGKSDDTKPSKGDDTKSGKKAHVSTISGHDSGANKKNSKITNAAASALADEPNRNTSVGGANDKANKTNRTVQAAVVNNDKNVLPQTGESQNKTGIIGMAFAILAGMFGLAGTKKKRKND